MLIRRCKIYFFLQNEENSNVLLDKRQKSSKNVVKKANIIYDIQCFTCKKQYIVKTDRCFVTFLDEYGIRYDQPNWLTLS